MMPASPHSNPSQCDPLPIKPMVDIQSITVCYAQKPALENISFSVDAGQILAVIGPNGAGKTTLIRALSSVVPLTAGKVLVGGKDLALLNAAERARQIAVVPQARTLPPAFTGWETVVLGRTPYLNWLGQVSAADERIAREAMRQTDTLALAERRAGELSGGEQQRLLLARALAQASPILLLDEPTTHLDMQYQLSLLEKINSLVQEKKLTVILALHDLNLAGRFADRVALLVGGQLRAVGVPEEILRPDILTKAYGVALNVITSGKSHYPIIIPKFLQ